MSSSSSEGPGPAIAPGDGAVGFIGMGRMGRPMAARLLAAGWDLIVHNRTSSACADLVAAGAESVATPREVGERCAVVFTMLADAAAAESVCLGPDGVLAGAAPGSVLVEMSTIGPESAKRLAAAAAEREVTMLDAPVSGSITAAAAGRLLFMVGGEVAVMERVKPLLEAMSAGQQHLGPSGSGAAMKLAVNCVVATTNEAVAEALNLAESYGIAGERAYGVLEASAVASPFITVKRGGYLQPDEEEIFFSVELMLKDLDLAQEMALEAGAALPAAEAVARALAATRDAGAGTSDFSAVAELLRQARGGVEARAGREPELRVTEALRERLVAPTKPSQGV